MESAVSIKSRYRCATSARNSACGAAFAAAAAAAEGAHTQTHDATSAHAAPPSVSHVKYATQFVGDEAAEYIRIVQFTWENERVI